MHIIPMPLGSIPADLPPPHPCLLGVAELPENTAVVHAFNNLW